MSKTNFQIIISEFTVEVEQKDIKNVYLRVCPPDGRIKLSSPENVSAESLRQFVVSKEDWIRKKIKKVRSQARKPRHEFATGESHYVQGQKYSLNVFEVNKAPRVVIRNNGLLDLYIRQGSDQAKREKVLREWYRELLKSQIPELIAKWERELGVTVREWGVKKMKTRWGTCSTKARRIWLNLELAKRPKSLLDYVVLHEMVHLKERLHNHRFRSFLDKHMPDWRDREKELKKRLP
jgi:hypothetical protein